MSLYYIYERQTKDLSRQKYREQVFTITKYINSIPLVLDSERNTVIEVLLPRLKTHLIEIVSQETSYLCCYICIKMCEKIMMEMAPGSIDVWFFATIVMEKIDAYVKENLDNIIEKPH